MAVKSKHQKGGRSGGRNGRLTKKYTPSVVRQSNIHEKEGGKGSARGGEGTFCAVLPQRRIAAYLIFTTCTNHDISLHPVGGVGWGGPLTARSRLKGAVATFTIPSLFSDAVGEQAKTPSRSLTKYPISCTAQIRSCTVHRSSSLWLLTYVILPQLRSDRDNRISRGEREACRTNH